MFICPICMDLFDTALSNSVTNCGHVFHERCLNDWWQNHDASKSCPSCRGPANGNSSRIYLQFDPDYEARVENLQVELDSVRTQLSDSKAKSDSSSQELKFQIDILEAENQKLIEEGVELASLQSAYEESNEQNAEVRFLLDIEIEKCKQLEEDIGVLRDSQSMYERCVTENRKEIMKMQQEYNKILSAYQKDIVINNLKIAAGFLNGILETNTTQNIKVERSSGDSESGKENKPHEDLEIEKCLEKILLIDSRNVLKERNFEVSPHKLCDRKKRRQSKDLLNSSFNSDPTFNTRHNSLSRRSNSSQNLRPQRDCVENKVVVRGVCFDDIQRSAVEYIIALAMHSNMYLRSEDIKTAEIQQHAMSNDEHCSIFVVFHSFDIRQQFLKLKGLPVSVHIVEALTKEAYSLFRQAEILYYFGFSSVYHQGGEVFVRRGQYTDAIRIRGAEDIKKLKKRKV